MQFLRCIRSASAHRRYGFVVHNTSAHNSCVQYSESASECAHAKSQCRKWYAVLCTHAQLALLAQDCTNFGFVENRLSSTRAFQRSHERRLYNCKKDVSIVSIASDKKIVDLYSDSQDECVIFSRLYSLRVARARMAVRKQSFQKIRSVSVGLGWVIGCFVAGRIRLSGCAQWSHQIGAVRKRIGNLLATQFRTNTGNL